MEKGWLVNDKLTCIPNTETFWHDLLKWLPLLHNKAQNIDFPQLPSVIENDYNSCSEKPSYIIRNATFFRKLNIPVKTISLLQDNYINGYWMSGQLDVCNSSDVTVFNSPYVFSLYQNMIKSRYEIIPLGTDFNFFRPLNNKIELKQKYEFKDEPYIIFIGASTDYPKGFDTLLDIINQSNFNFCLVMKDDYKSDNPRVKVFNRISHEQLLEVINCCDVALCTSKMETLHLAGVECAACGLPVISTNVGIYHNDFSESWGHICITPQEFISNINKILNNYTNYSSRKSFFDKGLSKETCQNKWVNLIKSQQG